MALAAGTRLGPYEILAPLGAGGMGEVYRARDTKLGREVALKTLPPQVAGDAERLTRFQREATLLASLNHPHIAAIYGLEEEAGNPYLVLELVEGEDLAERLKRDPIPVGEALDIARQIAEALEEAHENGIVHRDLKPANIKIKPEGQVKILDFGLAKALEGNAPGSDLSQSPTLAHEATQAGVILGTAAYMSPEQAHGKPVDWRTDIWAFGCVLYEMLTRTPAFRGEDVVDVLAAITKEHPEWERLPRETPLFVRRLLRLCLAKDPRHRLHHVADLRILLTEVEHSPCVQSSAGRRRRLALLPWGLFGFAVVTAVVVWWQSQSTSPQAMVRFGARFPPGTEAVWRTAPPFDISPDGRSVVWALADSGKSRLYLRPLDRVEGRFLPGTEGAEGPFFSPTGDWIGFRAEGNLKRVGVSGTPAQVICAAPLEFQGATWLGDDTIVFAPDFDSGLYRVSAEGGTPEVLTRPDRDRGESRHSLPYALPGGKGVVFSTSRSGPQGVTSPCISVVSLQSGQISTLIDGPNSSVRFFEPGYLLFVQSGQLLALPFDQERLEPNGEPIAVSDLTVDGGGIGDYIALSGNGTLVHSIGSRIIGRSSPWSREGSTLVLVDREGGEVPLSQEPGDYVYPALSPDGKRLAVTESGHFWVYEMDGARRIRLADSGVIAAWTPTGERVAFGSYRPDEDLYWAAADGSGVVEPLLLKEGRQYPGSWDPRGQLLVILQTDPSTGYDLWILRLDDEPTAEPFLNGPFQERTPSLSPGGHWIAYVSNESGRDEIYVRSFPDGSAKQAVSSDGGTEPLWSPQGDELFFRNGRAMFSVPAKIGTGRLDLGLPTRLFEADYLTDPCCGRFYDVTPEGDRFIMIKGGSPPSAPSFWISVNWLQELQERL